MAVILGLMSGPARVAILIWGEWYPPASPVP